LCDDVILSDAMDLLFIRGIGIQSRFFSAATDAGLQNDIIQDFSTTY